MATKKDYVVGSGNVFADLGYARPEEAAAKGSFVGIVIPPESDSVSNITHFGIFQLGIAHCGRDKVGLQSETRAVTETARPGPPRRRIDASGPREETRPATVLRLKVRARRAPARRRRIPRHRPRPGHRSLDHDRRSRASLVRARRGSAPSGPLVDRRGDRLAAPTRAGQVGPVIDVQRGWSRAGPPGAVVRGARHARTCTVVMGPA